MGFSGNKLAFMNSGGEDAREKWTPRDAQKGAAAAANSRRGVCCDARGANWAQWNGS